MKTYTRKSIANQKEWPGKNLCELIRFLKEQFPQGLQLQQLSERIGTSRSNLSRIFKKDDAKLSVIEEMTKKLGYTVILSYPVREQLIPREKKPTRFKNAGNLKGLAQYISDANISPCQMDMRINLSTGVTMRAFKNGDIKMSYLYKIAEDLRIDIIWKFEKNQ